MSRKPSAQLVRALDLYKRLVLLPKDNDRVTVLKHRALTRRILSFLESCSDRDYDAYYQGVADIRHPRIRVKIRRPGGKAK